MSSSRTVLIAGGGIVGLATAYRLLGARPDLRVIVLEKEVSVGLHQSGNNSGVLHAGLYYRPGSHKARLAVRGIRQMLEFCRAHEVPHRVCGKLVVAVEDEEVPRLRTLYDRGRQNGLSGLRWLDGAAAREIEPHVRAVAAVHVPEEGVADFSAVCRALAGRIIAAGGEVRTGTPLRALRRDGADWVAETDRQSLRADFFVNCAGLHSDRVARMAGADPGLRIVPFRGEYFLLRPDRADLVRNLIYPVPDPSFPFLGVHFTRRVGGEVEAGPNAVLAASREGYRWSDVDASDLAEAVLYPGLWRFLLRHPIAVAAEAYRSAVPSAFRVALQRLLPEIRADDLLPGGAGVRAQAMRPDGRLVEDFHFVRQPHALHVINAPSPAATASLALGEVIAEAVLESAGLQGGTVTSL